MLDGRSRKPILGSLRYVAFDDKAGSKTSVTASSTWLDHYHYQTDAEGRFEIPVLPGKGVLGFSAHNWQAYPQGVGLDKVQAAPPPRRPRHRLRTLNRRASDAHRRGGPRGRDDDRPGSSIRARPALAGRNHPKASR